MLDDNHLFQRASMAAFTAYNSFCPSANISSDPVNYFGYAEGKREELDDSICLKVEGLDLWKRFSSIGNEMIITKNGRRLFPTFRVSVSELDPNVNYMFLLDIVPIDDIRYKYQESAWTAAGKGEPHIYGRHYIHPDSPQTGAQWMRQSISFNKVKITNSPMLNPNQILLNSMHRYILRLHIVQATDDYTLRTGPLKTFMFEETTFIAVTAYQNEQIKNLKIDNNPFAKGFRELPHDKKKPSKSLKRLQLSLPVDKPKKSDEYHARLYKSDSSLLSGDSKSPPSHSMIHPSTTPAYENHDDLDKHDHAAAFLNFSSMYPHHQFSYNPYINDPSAMAYAPSYPYTGPSSGYPMSFSPYGYYQSPVYHSNSSDTPFF